MRRFLRATEGRRRCAASSTSPRAPAAARSSAGAPTAPPRPASTWPRASSALEAQTARRRVEVVSLAPGVIDTPMQGVVRGASAEDFVDVERFRQMKADGTLRARRRRRRRHPAPRAAGKLSGRSRSQDLRQLERDHRPLLLRRGHPRDPDHGGFQGRLRQRRWASSPRPWWRSPCPCRRPRRSCCRSSCVMDVAGLCGLSRHAPAARRSALHPRRRGGRRRAGRAHLPLLRRGDDPRSCSAPWRSASWRTACASGRRTAPAAPSVARGLLLVHALRARQHRSPTRAARRCRLPAAAALDKAVLVGTTVIFFAVINVVKLVPYAWLGLFDARNLAHLAGARSRSPRWGSCWGVASCAGSPRTLLPHLLRDAAVVGAKLLWDGIARL